MAPEITFSGIGSGIDTDDMLSKLVEAEKTRYNNLEKEKVEWQSKLDAVTEINSKMNSVITSLDSLRTPESFYARVVSADNTEVADVAVDSSASLGAYNVVVASNTKHILASARAWADTDTSLLNTEFGGIFKFDDGTGTVISAELTDEMTLTQFREAVQAAIDAADSSAKIEIKSDGSSANPYRVYLSGGAGGVGKNIQILSDKSGLIFDGTHVDTLEKVDWKDTPENAISINAESSYSGHVTKRINFAITEGGTLGEDDIVLKWIDSVENRSGTIAVDKAGSFDVLQGLSIDFNAVEGEITKGTTFAVDLFANDVQIAQKEGIAKVEKEVHFGHADYNNTAVSTADGTFSYSFAGEQIAAIQVKGGTTLKGLENLVNKDPNNPGVRATVINDGLGSANSYHLVLSSSKPGAANRIDNISYELDNFESETGFVETQKATNAMFKVNNYPLGDDWLQRSTNLITDVVEGASLTLKSAGELKFTVSNDNDAMTDKVSTFVTAFNDATDYLASITQIVISKDGSRTAGALFAGDYSIRMMQSRLAEFVTSRPAGFDGDADEYVLLSQIGITLNNNRGLDFDVLEFRDKLEENPDQLIEFFSADRAGSSDNSHIQYYSALTKTQGGVYEVKSQFDEKGNVISGQYRKENSDTWHDMIAGNNNLLTATTGDAIGMAVQAIWDGSSSEETANISVKVGKANEYYYEMTEFFDTDEGITKVMSENYEKMIESVDESMDRELRRVAQVEERLKKQFVNLEVAMNKQQGQLTQLEQQMAQLQ